jgi:hypothetical protein
MWNEIKSVFGEFIKSTKSALKDLLNNAWEVIKAPWELAVSSVKAVKNCETATEGLGVVLLGMPFAVLMTAGDMAMGVVNVVVKTVCLSVTVCLNALQGLGLIDGEIREVFALGYMGVSSLFLSLMAPKWLGGLVNATILKGIVLSFQFNASLCLLMAVLAGIGAWAAYSAETSVQDEVKEEIVSESEVREAANIDVELPEAKIYAL